MIKTQVKNSTKPFLRWAGSKRQLIPNLSKYWSDNCIRYIEPFVGSAILFFNINPSSAILGDINSELITTYEQVKNNLPALVVELTEYDYQCSICGMKFQYGELIEAQATHIVPKHKSGTDDPRNGLSLCRTHHWAFDNGLFSLSENYQIEVSPVVSIADTTNFRLAEYSKVEISLPRNEIIYPHPSALDWHRKNIFQGRGTAGK